MKVLLIRLFKGISNKSQLNQLTNEYRRIYN